MNNEEIIEIDDRAIERLKKEAHYSRDKRARLCLHNNSDEYVHEMVLVMCRGSYIRPHKHPLGKSESYSILDGEMDVLIYNDQGTVIRRIEMGLPGSGKTFLYRLSMQLWHAPISRTNTVAFIEVYTGPFCKSVDVEYAPWSRQE